MKRALFFIFMSSFSLLASQGFYVGGGFGGQFREASESAEVSGEFISSSTEMLFADLQPNFFDHGVAGIVYAGYGITCDCLRLSAEGFVQFGSAKIHNSQRNLLYSDFLQLNQIPTLTKVETKSWQAGVDLLPGWVFNRNTEVYGRIGISGAKTTLEVSSVSNGFLGTEIINLPLFLSESKTRAAFRAGAGIQQRLCERISIRADYIYTDFGKLSVDGGASGLTSEDNPVTLRNKTSLHLYDHAVLIGLNYNFGCVDSLTEEICCDQNNYEGFYLGGSVGGGALFARQGGGADSFALTPFHQVASASSQLYNNQAQGMFFGGYGRSWKWAYLGGEVFGSAASHTKRNFKGRALNADTSAATFFVNYQASVETATWQWGFDLRPGALLTPCTLLYGRVGVASAQLKARIDSNSGAGVDLFTLTSSDKKSKAAFRLGLGIEHSIARCLHLRADYIFSNYGLITLDDSVSRVVIGGETRGLRNTLSSHIQDHGLVVGLSYYFH